jgi:hypothetical protein
VTTTNQFKWVDRDTAGRDLLQLAWHGPPFIRQHALSLLRAIRSSAIVPDLEAIVSDTMRDIWERRYALRAIAATPGNFYRPQFAEYLNEAFVQRSVFIQKQRTLLAKHPDFRSGKRDVADNYLGNDLIDDIRGFVDKHPINRDWFFTVMDKVPEPTALRRFLIGSLNYEQSQDLDHQLLERLLQLLEQHPHLFSLSVIRTLSQVKDTSAKAWLEQHINQIIDIFSQNLEDRDVSLIASNWDMLRQKLTEKYPEFKAVFGEHSKVLEESRASFRQPNETNTTLALQSPAYLKLSSLYDQAAQGNSKAYSRLIRMAEWWTGNVPVRAVATYYLGKLQNQYDSTRVLLRLLTYAVDDWGDSEVPPIRMEAGEALRNVATPQVWEGMVNAFFINPRNVLSSFLIDWITHLTDRLSGGQTEYNGVNWNGSEGSRMFGALAEVSADDPILKLGEIGS